MTISKLMNLPLMYRLFGFPNSKMRSGTAANRQTENIKQVGRVYLVGAGPGDAELLTLKAYRYIQDADVVLYDWLVSPDIVNMIPKHVEKVFVGKKCGRHSMTQQEICQRMSDLALSGKAVVRLKGGDPSIFGRAAEEVEHLQQLNIEFAIIPGITAASGCAAWSGIPLTHRDCAHSVRFITAHFKSDDIEADWKNYAESNDTLVFYMGLNKVRYIAQQLILNSKPKHTPMAIIDQGTTDGHKTYISDLEHISDILNSKKIVGPALIVVGDAINYRANVNVDLLSEVKQRSSVIPQVA